MPDKVGKCNAAFGKLYAHFRIFRLRFTDQFHKNQITRWN